MRQGRDSVLCAAAFLAGNLLGGWLPFPAWIFLTAAVTAALFTLLHPSRVLILCTMLLLGATALQVERLGGAPVAESRLEKTFRRVQARCAAGIDRLLPPGAERAVAKALSLGDRRELDRATRTAFRTSGASHLMALSGLHVGILYKLLSALLFPLGATLPLRRLRSLLVLGFLWSYALLSGMSPSISRAVLMITVYEGAALAGRRSDAPGALALSALLITLLHPEAPREISFQLSFGACLGIFWFHPFLKGLLRTRSRMLRAIWNGATLALSCQMVTALPAWFYFRSFPRYFLLTNLLALPLVTASLYLIVLLLPASFCGLSPTFTCDLLQGILSLLNRVLRTIAALP